LLHFRLQELIIWLSRPIGDLKLHMPALVIHPRKEIIERELLRGSEYALAPHHQAGVFGDVENPRTDPLGFAEMVEILKHFEQCLLRHFLSVFAVPAHQPTIVEDLGPEVFHKAIERFWSSSNQLPREFNFVVTFQGPVRSDCSEP